jgi:hypothetical protein
MLKITCYKADYLGEIKPDSEIEEAVWITSKDKEKCSVLLKHLLEDLVAKNLID